mgnify:CR=1 FL=1
MISGRKATGKNPLEDSWDRDFGPADVELALRKNPNLQAVGIYTGIRGKGIVILDDNFFLEIVVCNLRYILI